ncbi:hypothetical protein AAE026_39420, partial [Bradyrhizobium sp. DN5]
MSVWSPGQVCPGEPWALLREQGASPWAQARAALQDPLQEAAASESGEPQAAVAWAHAAAEPRPAAAKVASRQAAGVAAWETDALQAVPEEAGSAHAAAAPRPAA